MGCSPGKEAAQPKPREIVSESGTGYTYTVTSAYPGPTLLQKGSTPEDGRKLSPMRSRGDKSSPDAATEEQAKDEETGDEVLMHISL
eukprot:symbB.v1.2.019307.t1/scaffold1554.1/size111945/13